MKKQTFKRVFFHGLAKPYRLEKEECCTEQQAVSELLTTSQEVVRFTFENEEAEKTVFLKAAQQLGGIVSVKGGSVFFPSGKEEYHFMEGVLVNLIGPFITRTRCWVPKIAFGIQPPHYKEVPKGWQQEFFKNNNNIEHYPS